VTFELQASKSETTIVQAKAGELVDVASPPPPEPPPAPALPSVPPSAAPRLAFEPTPSKPVLDVYETRRPFSPLVLAISGGLDVAAAVAAVALESRALDLRDGLTSPSSSGQISTDDRHRFDEERTWAYAAIGSAAGLGAVTASLVSWYFLGSSKHAVLIQPAMSPERGGAIAGALAHF
jgi:hypothetical protein